MEIISRDPYIAWIDRFMIASGIIAIIVMMVVVGIILS